MRDSLRKDYFWNSLGVFFQNAISPLFLIVITRFNGIDDSGLFSFAFSISFIFFAFGMWGGRTYQVSDTHKEFSQNSYIAVRLILSVVMVVGSVAFCIANSYDLVKSGVIIVLVVFKAVESVADAFYGVLQFHDRLYLAGRSLIYKAVTGFLLFVVTILLTHDIFLASVGILLANISIFFGYDVPRARQYEDLRLLRVDARKTFQESLIVLRRTAPIFGVLFLTAFSLNIPRYFVDLHYQSEIGYFGIIAMPITLLVLLMSFILQPNIVRLSQLYRKRNYIQLRTEVRKILLITLGLGVLGFFATMFIGVEVLRLIYGVDFSRYFVDLMIVVVGGVVNTLVAIFMNILIIARKIKKQLYVLFGTNIALAIASGLLIPRHGLTMAMVLFATTNIIQLVLLGAIYHITLSSKKNEKRN